MKPNERIRIGFLIHDVSRLRRTAFDQRMKPLGITRSQWWVLVGVSRHGEQGITQTELANVLDLGKVALGGLLDRLDEGGFVLRRTMSNDRRVKRVYLTPKGTGVLEEMHEIALEMNETVMKGITQQQQHELSRILHLIKVNLVAMDVVPGAKRRAAATAAADRGAAGTSKDAVAATSRRAQVRAKPSKRRRSTKVAKASAPATVDDTSLSTSVAVPDHPDLPNFL